MIKLILIDVDGVLTDGKLIIGQDNSLFKQLNFRDLDALSMLKNQGYRLGIITGEKDFFTDCLYGKIKPDFFETNCKQKKEAVIHIAQTAKCSLNEICYIGDGKYDIDAITSVGLGVCPQDAITEVKNVADLVLNSKGGSGCLAELATLLQRKNECFFSPSDYATGITDIIQQHQLIINEVLADKILNEAICKAIAIITESLRRGGQLLLCGNGGSAADAQHIATELVSRFYIERKALNAEALTTNTSTLTAVANDYDFCKVYSRQVEAKGRSGDVLIGITTSGTSINIVNALETAKQCGLQTITFTGKNAKSIEDVSDVVISVPSTITPRIQEIHILIGHIICEYVERNLSFTK